MMMMTQPLTLTLRATAWALIFPLLGAPQNGQRDQEPVLLDHAQAAEAGRA